MGLLLQNTFREIIQSGIRYAVAAITYVKSIWVLEHLSEHIEILYGFIREQNHTYWNQYGQVYDYLNTVLLTIIMGLYYRTHIEIIWVYITRTLYWNNMGLAITEQILKGNQWVYITYTHIGHNMTVYIYRKKQLIIWSWVYITDLFTMK